MNTPDVTEQPESANAGCVQRVVMPQRHDIQDGWVLENGMPNGCSRIVTPDGKTAVYRYQETSTDEAYLLKWGYIEGRKAGTNEMVDKIKTRLGLYEA